MEIALASPGKPRPPRARAVVQRKGGVGKTTTVVDVAHALALRGQRGLVVDVDNQKSSLTRAIGRASEDHEVELATVLLDPKRLDEAIVTSSLPGVDLIRGSARTISAERELEDKPGRDFVLRKIVEALAGRYDFIFFDCAASLSRLVIAAILAADEIIIPLKAQGAALVAVDETQQLMDEIVESGMRSSAPVMHALVTEYARNAHSAAVLAEIRADARLHSLVTPIPRNEVVAEAFNHGLSIFQYAPSSRGAAAYAAIAADLEGDDVAGVLRDRFEIEPDKTLAEVAGSASRDAAIAAAMLHLEPGEYRDRSRVLGAMPVTA